MSNNEGGLIREPLWVVNHIQRWLILFVLSLLWVSMVF